MIYLFFTYCQSDGKSVNNIDIFDPGVIHTSSTQKHTK